MKEIGTIKNKQMYLMSKLFEKLDKVTSVVFLYSILSLACSPSGSSFVCSAAALSRSGSCDSVPQICIPASGQLLLWDTKTVKQQVQEVACSCSD